MRVDHPAWEEWREGCRLRGALLRKILVAGVLVEHAAPALIELRRHRGLAKEYLRWRLEKDHPIFRIVVREPLP